jgi:hypothetical protein
MSAAMMRRVTAVIRSAGQMRWRANDAFRVAEAHGVGARGVQACDPQWQQRDFEAPRDQADHRGEVGSR